MIPDFNTYLKESIWSNINKRSEGNLERKEDYINDLNQDELFDYIKENYEPMSQYDFDNNHSYKKNDISIPVILPAIASYSYAANLRFEKFGKIVVFGKDIEYECPEVYKLIVDNYMISEFGRFLFCISPKDGSNKIDNNFFIGFLDFLIDNVKDTDKEKLIIKKK